MKKFEKGDRVTTTVPGMTGVWVVEESDPDGGRTMVTVVQGASEETLGEDDLQPFTTRGPGELTAEELVGLVSGLREMMYAGVDDGGNDVWEPDRDVSGADLVEWVAHEMLRLGIVPEAGPRR